MDGQFFRISKYLNSCGSSPLLCVDVNCERIAVVDDLVELEQVMLVIELASLGKLLLDKHWQHRAMIV